GGGDGVDDRAGGRIANGGDDGVGDTSAGSQGGDGVAQSTRNVGVAIAAPGEAGDAGGQQVTDEHAGGGAGTAVGDDDGVGGGCSRDHGGQAIILGDADIVLGG